jgi:hypothetical protein
MKELHVFPDLASQLLKQSGEVVKPALKVNTPGGHPVADSETPNPLHDNCLHLQDNSGCVQETLDAMGLAIVETNWIHFFTLVYKLTGLRPTQARMIDFFKEQIADAVVRNTGVVDLETIRRKLIEIGAKEKTLDEGYEIGTERVKQLQSKKRRRA